MMTSPPAIALDPVIDATTKVLLMGSLPGRVSLEQRRYYAHPQNQFWRLVGGVVGTDLARLDYPDRLAALLRSGIGLWDVIGSATRTGSLDSAIRDATIRDLGSLLDAYPGLRALAFNGGTAYRIGVRQLGDAARLPLLALPSSSAAYTIEMAAKQVEWNGIRAFLDP